MAELLSPGVFNQEVPSAVQVVQPVSTSNAGMAGATQRGPTDEAMLITSFEQFTRVFGALIADSRLGMSVAAFFANGGRRAFVVRVMPGDAVKAVGASTSARRNFQSNVGDGVTAAVTQLVLTPTVLNVPIVSVAGVAGVTFRWRSNGAPLAASPLRNRLNTLGLVQDTVGHPLHAYEGRINPTALPAMDTALPSVMPHETMTLNWDPDGGGLGAPLTLTLVQVGTTMVASGTSGQGSKASLNLVTGRISISFAGTDVPVVGGNGTAITLDFTPGTAVRSISDNGSGVLVNIGLVLTGNGTITYGPLGVPATYAMTCAAGFEIGDGCPLLVNYNIQAWQIQPVSVGTWANDMRVVIVGSPDYYDIATDTYSRFDVYVTMLNTSTGLYDTLETYEEISFNDPTLAQYFPDVINDLSDLITVVEPAYNAEGPSALNGLARSFNVAAGDALTGSRNIVTTLPDFPLVRRTVNISFTDSGGFPRVITDDGAGNLIGDVDGAGANTIDYTNGNIDVTVSNAIAKDLLVYVVYRSESEEDTHTNTFLGGTDGTFDATNYGRNQFTSPTLVASYKGLYALNRIEELMQVIIPDFAGDVQITKDLLDYADGRQNQPAGGDRFIILVVPQDSTAQEAVDWVRYELNQYSKYAAIYWPWVKVANPLSNNRPMVFPPLGHIAGIYARTDSTRNVGKAPAGTVDGSLKFLIGLESINDQAMRDYVYPNRINPLISSPQTGLALWGTRTLSLDSSWRYIPATRLFMFVEKSIFNSTHWIVFEPNGSALWSRIKAQIQGFLLGLFNDGLFAGSTPSQAFFVICDESNNDQASIDAGKVVIDIGIAPNRPAEFVVFRYQQKTLES